MICGPALRARFVQSLQHICIHQKTARMMWMSSMNLLYMRPDPDALFAAHTSPHEQEQNSASNHHVCRPAPLVQQQSRCLLSTFGHHHRTILYSCYLKGLCGPAIMTSTLTNIIHSAMLTAIRCPFTLAALHQYIH